MDTSIILPLLLALATLISLLSLKLSLRNRKSQTYPHQTSLPKSILILVLSNTVLQPFFIRSAINKLYFLLPLSFIALLVYLHPHQFIYCWLGTFIVLLGRILSIKLSIELKLVSIGLGLASLIFGVLSLRIIYEQINEKSYGICVGMNVGIDQGIRIISLLVLGGISKKYNFLQELVDECLGLQVKNEKSVEEEKQKGSIVESHANMMSELSEPNLEVVEEKNKEMKGRPPFFMESNKICPMSPNTKTMETLEDTSTFSLSTKKNKKYSMNSLFIKQNLFDDGNKEAKLRSRKETRRRKPNNLLNIIQNVGDDAQVVDINKKKGQYMVKDLGIVNKRYSVEEKKVDKEETRKEKVWGRSYNRGKRQVRKAKRPTVEENIQNEGQFCVFDFQNQ